VRTKDRVKRLGEVFTPPAFVEQMLKHIPSALWSDPSKTFCDPAGCGNGAFLVAVVRRRIEGMMQQGAPPEWAALRTLQTTYGVDIDYLNVTETRKNLLEQAEKSSKRKPTKRQLAEWKAVVEQNIIEGDALDPKTFDKFITPTPVVDSPLVVVPLQDPSKETTMSHAEAPPVAKQEEKQPAPRRQHDLDIRRPVWHVRVEEARQKKLQDLEAKAQAVLVKETKKINADVDGELTWRASLWSLVEGLQPADRVELEAMLHAQNEFDRVGADSKP
jgi:hypothetical protein